MSRDLLIETFVRFTGDVSGALQNGITDHIYNAIQIAHSTGYLQRLLDKVSSHMIHIKELSQTNNMTAEDITSASSSFEMESIPIDIKDIISTLSLKDDITDLVVSVSNLSTKDKKGILKWLKVLGKMTSKYMKEIGLPKEEGSHLSKVIARAFVPPEFHTQPIQYVLLLLLQGYASELDKLVKKADCKEVSLDIHPHEVQDYIAKAESINMIHLSQLFSTGSTQSYVRENGFPLFRKLGKHRVKAILALPREVTDQVIYTGIITQLALSSSKNIETGFISLLS